MLELFVGQAWAQTSEAAAAATSPGVSVLLMSYLPIVFIVVIFYMLIIRPQNQAAKVHAQMVKEVKRGDVILIDGGLIGEVSKVHDQILHLKVNPEDEVAVARASLKKVLSAEEAKGWEPAQIKKK